MSLSKQGTKEYNRTLQVKLWKTQDFPHLILTCGSTHFRAWTSLLIDKLFLSYSIIDDKGLCCTQKAPHSFLITLIPLSILACRYPQEQAVGSVHGFSLNMLIL
uniref:Uncharacterized protein n=1 Tax=Coturnix japonica TaxID=93934 RepID=A0A8C2SPB3_COTJA